jgi:hypothetical protein
MEIKNFTPHTVTILDDNNVFNVIITIPSSGVARCSSTVEDAGCVMHGTTTVPVVRQSLGTVEGLPEYVPGTYLVVSRVVAAACPDRLDLLVPDNLVRDSDGRIVGCRRFARV